MLKATVFSAAVAMTGAAVELLGLQRVEALLGTGCGGEVCQTPLGRGHWPRMEEVLYNIYIYSYILWIFLIRLKCLNHVEGSTTNTKTKTL